MRDVIVGQKSTQHATRRWGFESCADLCIWMFLSANLINVKYHQTKQDVVDERVMRRNGNTSVI